MLDTALYINTSYHDGNAKDQNNWREVDLNDDVAIVLNDSIKQAKDVGKVMTSFSQTFTVPASKTNNQVFKYYHSFNALDGFDARRKHEAILKINGFDFKKGYIKLNTVNMKDNSPMSYEIQFFGELASLKDILGDSHLHELSSLNRFNHDYNTANTKAGLEDGIAFDYSDLSNILQSVSTDGDIKYPLISHTRGFEWDNQGFHRILSVAERGGAYSVVANDRLKYPDLKPALRVSRIFDAIEWNFPQIQFNKTWLQSSPFNDLFIWLHRTKGYISYDPFEVGDQTHIRTYTVGDPTSGNEADYIVGPDGDLREPEGWFCSRASSGGQNGAATTFIAAFSITAATGSGEITTTIKAKRGATTYETDTKTFNVGDANSIDVGFAAPYGCGWYAEITVEADNTVVNVTPEIQILKQVGDLDFNATYGPGAPVALTSEIIVPLLMPKMKIVDFLSYLFKMFNLVGYEERNLDGTWKIKIEPADDYYAAGTSYDITPFVDITESAVERVTPYGSIDFDWPEPKTFLAYNQSKLTGDDFGASHFDSQFFEEGDSGTNTLLFDGGNYEVMPKFEKMMYERMSDVDTDALTDIQWGWFVNDNKENIPEPTLGAPLLLFIEQTDVQGTDTIEWTDASTSDRYGRPSSVKTDNSLTLHFNEEFDEWTRDTVETSLFNNYHAKYIGAIYSPYARRFKCDAWLPSTMHMKVELNDTLLINNVPFIIDLIKTNLTTGRSKLELLRMTDELTVYPMDPEEVEGLVWNTTFELWEAEATLWEGGAGAPPDVTPPSVPTGIASSNITSSGFDITWTPSTDDTAVVGYEVFLDTVSQGTTATESWSFTGLSPSTSYDVNITAYDAVPNTSAQSATFTESTIAAPDVTPPSVPTGLTEGTVTDTTIQFSWTASTDDTAVTGYEVFVDGISNGTTASTSYTVTGLDTNTEYSLTVRAYDAVPNYSAQSTALLSTTDVSTEVDDLITALENRSTSENGTFSRKLLSDIYNQT